MPQLQFVLYSGTSDSNETASNNSFNGSSSNHDDKCYGLERDDVYRILVVGSYRMNTFSIAEGPELKPGITTSTLRGSYEHVFL